MLWKCEHCFQNGMRIREGMEMEMEGKGKTRGKVGR